MQITPPFPRRNPTNWKRFTQSAKR